MKPADMEKLTQTAMNPEIMERINKVRVVAVLIIDHLEDALPLAEALLKGGITAIELTLRTPVAWEAAKLIKETFPEILLGFGTVLTPNDVQMAKDHGADFAVSPGCNVRVIQAAREAGLSFAPGICTPSEIETAMEQGCSLMKFFPAETSGGIKHLNSMVAPYQHLGLKFIPLGGVNDKNAREYLASPHVAAIGGSWIADRGLIVNKKWEQIERNASDLQVYI